MNKRQLRPKARKNNTRDYRRLVLIVTEGKTEKLYFTNPLLLGDAAHSGLNVKVDCRQTSRGTEPKHVLASMVEVVEEYKRRGLLRSGDPAWLVIDDDGRDDQAFAELAYWALSRDDRNIAYSKPQFEYWILLHYCDGHNVATQKECLEQPKRHDPKYEKTRNQSLRFDESVMWLAIQRAQNRTAGIGEDFKGLRAAGSAVTSVHLLVGFLLGLSLR